VLASQSEVALDRSETFLRNQDPMRTWADRVGSAIPATLGALAKRLD